MACLMSVDLSMFFFVVCIIVTRTSFTSGVRWDAEAEAGACHALAGPANPENRFFSCQKFLPKLTD